MSDNVLYRLAPDTGTSASATAETRPSRTIEKGLIEEKQRAGQPTKAYIGEIRFF